MLAVNRIGGQSALGRLLSVTQSTVFHWVDKTGLLPAEHVLKVEAATGVPRHDLRPDLYPRGLQDDVPFRPDVLELGELELPVADEKGPVLQREAGEAA